MIRSSSILRWTALCALLFAALLRAQTTRARLPYWDLDPTRVSIPETSLLYSHALLLDALVWLAAAVMIVGETLAGRRIHWKSGVLVLIGAVGVALHGYWLPPPGATPGGPLHGDFMGLALGSAWAAALVGGWTILHLARDDQLKRAAALTLFGFVATLVAKGAYQVFIEHAATVKAYKADPASFLAAQGMQPDGTEAKEFERRLYQPEAIGWFGLANVYGTLIAGSFTFFLGLTIAAWKLARDKQITTGPAGVMAIATLLAAYGFWLSGSKGALGAAIAGCLVLSLGFLSHSAPRMGEVDGRSGPAGEGSISTFSTSISCLLRLSLPLLLCIATLIGVAARGAIGERLHELSLLFRYQYLVAAVRIFAHNPLHGVGPMGFKNAYALHKVPINPEMVESPHSVLFDWSATLGLFGIAWCLVLIWMLLRIGSGLSSSPKPQAPSPHRRATAPVLAAVILAGALSWLRESPVVTLDEWPLRLIALGVWCALIVIGTRIAVLAPRAFTIALAAAATAVAVHSMIEMTPTQPGSCMWVMLVIGVAGVGGRSAASGGKGAVVSVPAAVQVGAIVLLLLSASAPTARVLERRLAHAASVAHRIIELRVLVSTANQDPSQENRAALSRFLDTINRSNDISRADLDEDVLLAEVCLRIETIAALNGGQPDVDTRFMDVVEKQMQILVVPEIFDAGKNKAAKARLGWDTTPIGARMAISAAMVADDEYGRTLWSRSVRWRAMTASIFAAVTPDADSGFRVWREVIKLDPYSLTPVLNAYRCAREFKDPEAARTLAQRVLRNNAYLRLDPLKQLPPSEVADIQRFLAETAPNSPAEPANPAPPT